MNLNDIIKNFNQIETVGNTDIEINGLCADSAKAAKGDLFFCYKGGKHDSHDCAKEAVSRGAAAIVCEHRLDLSVPQIVVRDGRAGMARFARVFYGYADEKLKIYAVTGTNGKTTTTYMLNAIFAANGNKTGIIGTLGISYCDKFIVPELTTPDPIYLHSVFADMVKCGVETVFMEISAHALYYGKTDGISFETGIFTNCTQDHLDFFGNMKDYAECKKSLFADGKCRSMVINSDDATGLEILSENPSAVSYGIDNPADVFAVDITEKINGTSYVINLFDELYEIKLKLPALHNVYNSMAAAACAHIAGIKTSVIAKGLASLEKVSGRLERVAKYNGADIFVDFAHTPDGLEKSLGCLKKLCRGKLYCLFGCGGNRDRSKRPLMGEVAGKYADFCILTSDNPRYEDPYDIICEIEKGLKPSGKNYVTVTERDIATEYAVRLLSDGDILLVAGKGGERYQEIMGIKHAYDDNTVIKKLSAVK